MAKGKRGSLLYAGVIHIVSKDKARWHNTPEYYTCTIVPSTAPEVKALRNRYVKPNVQGMVNAAATTVSDPRKTVEESSASTSAALLEQPSMEVSINEEPELESKVGEIEETVDTPNSHAPTATTQATLLSFNPPIHPGKDLTLENVMDAIAGLSLKVANFGKHATLE